MFCGRHDAFEIDLRRLLYRGSTAAGNDALGAGLLFAQRLGRFRS